MKILHKSQLIPGHDCIYTPCKKDRPCQTTPPRSARLATGRNHGICADRWFYTAIFEDFSKAVTLEVSSDNYPDTIPAAHFAPFRPKVPCGNVLGFHWRKNEGDHCFVLEAPCEFDASFLRAGSFFKENGDNRFGQPSKFWGAMEALLREMD